MLEIRKDPWKLSCIMPLLEQGHLASCQHHAQRAFEYFQGRWIYNFPGQPLPLFSHLHNKKEFPNVQREPPVFELPLVLSGRTQQLFFSKARRWKLIYVFCSSVQLKFIAQDSLWQSLWFLSGRERYKFYSFHWNLLSAISSSELQGLEVDMSLISKEANVTFSQPDKNFASPVQPSGAHISAAGSSTSFQNWAMNRTCFKLSF